MTGDLAVWLRAQLDNDETLATQSGTRSCWRVAFTLADITAKKKLLAMYAAHDHSADADHRWSGFAGGYATATDQMLEALAQPYAGRPGWHNEWNVT